MHLDLDYAVGSAVNCKDILCCRAEGGYPTDPAEQAGKYGHLGFCDVPVLVLDKMAEKVNAMSPDALFWTGDVPPHD